MRVGGNIDMRAAMKNNLARVLGPELKSWKRSKSVWGMPWLPEATKDVVSCEKRRGGANDLRSVDVRMGQPDTLKTCRPRVANPLN